MDKLDNVSIIVAGKWNLKIFTPAWTLKELIGDEQNKGIIELAFDPSNIQPIYRHITIQIIPTESFIEFKIPHPFKKDLLIKSNQMAVKLLHLLPYTPGLAIGFNFRFQKKCVLSNFKLDNYHKDYQVKTISFGKSFENYLLTLIITCEEGAKRESNILYNFHYKDATLVKENTILDHLEYLKTKESWQRTK
jgi:hypothetical protein